MKDVSPGFFPPRKKGLILGYGGVNRKQIQDGMSKLASSLKAGL